MPLMRRTLCRSDVWREIETLFEASDENSIGLECEWPVYDVADPSKRPDLAILEAIARRPLPARSNVTIEPGGQIELSTVPARSAAEALAAIDEDSATLNAYLSEWGLYSHTVAIDHERRPERILQKPRYQAMQQFFDAGSAAGRWMMCNTASVQINIGNGQNPFERWKLLNTIGPILVAAFANSRGVDAHGAQWASLRQGIWWNIDNRRSRPIDVAPNLDPAVAWFGYALAADVMYIGDEGARGATGVAIQPGMSFGDWMVAGHPLGWPTIEDFLYHLTTLFPSIRPKGWYELRFLDALPSWMRTAAALVVETACVEEVTRELLAVLPQTGSLWLDAARDGLDNHILADGARILFQTVQSNLSAAAVGFDEVAQFTDRFVDRRLCPADELRAALPIRLDAVRVPGISGGYITSSSVPA